MNKGFFKLNHLEQKGIFCEGCGTNSGNFCNSLYHSSQFYYSTSINIRVLKVKENYFGKPIHLFTKVKRENHQILLNQKPSQCCLVNLSSMFSCYFMVSDNKDGDLRMFGT